MAAAPSESSGLLKKGESEPKRCWPAVAAWATDSKAAVADTYASIRSLLLSDRLYRIAIISVAANLLGWIVLAGLAMNTGWALISCIVTGAIINRLERQSRGLRADVVPSAAITVLTALWLLAALFSFMYKIGFETHTFGAPDPSNVLNVVFSTYTFGLLGVLLLLMYGDHLGSRWANMMERLGHPTPPRTKWRESCAGNSCRDRDGCCNVCCWILFVLLGVPSGVMACFMIWDFGFGLTFQGGSSLSNSVCTPAAPGVAPACLAYYCNGEIVDSSIVLVINGFGAVSFSYWWWLQDMQSATRTCVYDPRGTGWSGKVSGWFMADERFGFVPDAADVDAILSQELASHGIAKRNATAVLTAHSRGTLVATLFKATRMPEHGEKEYGRVVIVSLDGSTCDGNPVSEAYTDSLESEMDLAINLPRGFIIWVVAPATEFVAGFGLAAMWAKPAMLLAGMPLNGLPEGVANPLIPTVTVRNDRSGRSTLAWATSAECSRAGTGTPTPSCGTIGTLATMGPPSTTAAACSRRTICTSRRCPFASRPTA